MSRVKRVAKSMVISPALGTTTDIATVNADKLESSIRSLHQRALGFRKKFLLEVRVNGKVVEGFLQREVPLCSCPLRVAPFSPLWKEEVERRRLRVAFR